MATLQHGHDTLLSTELKRLDISIAGLQEVRWVGSGEATVGDFKLLWSGNSTHHTKGVALCVHHRLASAIISWRPVTPRLLCARLRHTFGHISIFVCYAPTDVADDQAKDEFYATIEAELRRTSRHDIILVLGDMNATVGPSREDAEHILGPHLSTTTNDNGGRMLDLCAAHNLKVLGTWFQHRRIHQSTWYPNTGTAAKVIDHILISGRWNIARDCRVFRSAELGSTDHRLLAATLRLSVRRLRTDARPPTIPDSHKLRSSEHALRYATEVANRFNALPPTSNLEDSWQQFSSTLTSTALNVLGRKRRRKQPWISDASLDLVERCREARLHRMDNYRDLCRERRRSLRQDRKAWLDRLASAAESNFRHGDLRTAYRTVKELCSQGGPPPVVASASLRRLADH